MCTMCMAVTPTAVTIKNHIACIAGRLVAAYTVYELYLTG